MEHDGQTLIKRNKKTNDGSRRDHILNKNLGWYHHCPAYQEMVKKKKEKILNHTGKKVNTPENTDKNKEIHIAGNPCKIMLGQN